MLWSAWHLVFPCTQIHTTLIPFSFPSSLPGAPYQNLFDLKKKVQQSVSAREMPSITILSNVPEQIQTLPISRPFQTESEGLSLFWGH